MGPRGPYTALPGLQDVQTPSPGHIMAVYGSVRAPRGSVRFS